MADTVTCPNCGSSVPAGRGSCNACGTPIQQSGGGSGSFCSNCGNPLPYKNARCASCGHTKTTVGAPPSHQPSPSPGALPPNIMYKSEGTTLILAIILGLLGLNGIGHLYVGKIARGVGHLIGSIVLFYAGLSIIVFGLLLMGWSAEADGSIVGFGVVLLILHFAMFIWQIIDARKYCRIYNEYVQANGRAPDNW